MPGFLRLYRQNRPGFLGIIFYVYSLSKLAEIGLKRVNNFWRTIFYHLCLSIDFAIVDRVVTM